MTLGQFIASSPTLFPPEYVQEFQKTLDQTPPMPWSVVKPLVVERQRHYTAEAFDTAQLVDGCDAPRECEVAADDAVWHCSAIVERGIFRCPGAMRHMVFCDPGSECDPAAALDAAVTDAAAVRAAMCAAPTPAPTLQPIALTLDF